MIDVAKSKGDLEMAKRYWNTYRCQSKLISFDERYYADYCKNRWCATCCGIRKAMILNKYYPIIKQWEKPHFHIITPTRNIALYLKQEWKKEWNKTAFNCSEKAQHLTEINNLEKGLVEVIKYGAKILCNPDPAKRKKEERAIWLV